MIKPYSDPFNRFEHRSEPIGIRFIIPDVINSIYITNTKKSPSDINSAGAALVGIISDSNRDAIIEVAKTKNLMVVHCWYYADVPTQITLAKTTFLWDISTDIRSNLVYSDGIAIEPDEQGLANMEIARFTLYFEPLPIECKSFILFEQTCEPYAFVSTDIERNDKDEYWAKVDAAVF